LLWRPVLSTRIPDGLDTVRRRWTMPDLLDAHLALDTLDEIDAIERERAERQREIERLRNQANRGRGGRGRGR